MYQRNYLLLLLLLAVCHGLCAQQVIPVSRYGIRPDTRADMSPRIQKMLKDLRKRTAQGEEVVLQFAPGRYDFHPDRAAERTYYISNHDQDNPKRVGIPLEGLKNVTLDGGGASFVFHGRMLPLSLLESEGCTLKNFSIDFENPHIAQVRILSADTLNGSVRSRGCNGGLRRTPSSKPTARDGPCATAGAWCSRTAPSGWSTTPATGPAPHREPA